MAVVCEHCREVFGLSSVVEVTVAQSVNDETVDTVCVVPEQADEAATHQAVTFFNIDGHLSDKASGIEHRNKRETEKEVDDDWEECKMKVKRPKLSNSCTHSSETTPSGSTSRLYCVTCLGILDKSFIDEIAASIPTAIQKEGYTGLTSFCIAIHTPLSLMIRRIGIEKYIQNWNSDQKSGYITLEGYVKEDLRTRLKEKLEQMLSLPYKMESPLQVIVKLDHLQSLAECQHLANMYPSCFRKKAKKGHFRNQKPREEIITVAPVRRALECATVEDCVRHGYLLPSVEQQCSLRIELLHKPLYLAGRYNKYSRSLPQTPWMVDGVKKADSSVQELICGELCRLTGCSNHTFFASGREDVDVRMLGTGRPFAVELNNPKNTCLSREDIDKVQEVINTSTDLVAVQCLTEVSKEETILLKEGERDKSKQYCALVWSEKEISTGELECLEGIKDLKIAQKTPIRVLHRRSLATRERTVYSMHSEVVDSHRFKLYLCSQAGTYIKEFVHGDFGRTQPSLGGLLSGRQVDILSLDVTHVQLEWPPNTVL